MNYVIYMNTQLIPDGHINDRLKEWYVKEGVGEASEHLNELEMKYWYQRSIT